MNSWLIVVVLSLIAACSVVRLALRSVFPLVT
jgi:hypothetical protein